MHSVRRLVVPLIVIVVAAVVLWPHVDREVSRVSMCIAGFGLVLAWYSILDLRERRNEKVWGRDSPRSSQVTGRPPSVPRPTRSGRLLAAVHRGDQISDRWWEVAHGNRTLRRPQCLGTTFA